MVNTLADCLLNLLVANTVDDCLVQSRSVLYPSEEKAKRIR